MTDRWANHEEVGSGDVFEALHSGLTVELISTPRDALMTCTPNDTLSVVMGRNIDSYDFIPVIAQAPGNKAHVLGLFHAAKFFHAPSPEGYVKEHYFPLSEEFLIGADASILDFIKTADERPCRLVISGSGIAGLVSLSDLQNLPVRAALFALITGFEITMAEAIKRKFPVDEDWLRCLNDGRQQKIKNEIAESRKDDGFVDTLLFTQFCDKADIITKSCDLAISETAFRTKLKDIEKLRNNLAHANEYAASPEQARKVCAVVKDLLALREKIAGVESSVVPESAALRGVG
jgi:hypothetical protein